MINLTKNNNSLLIESDLQIFPYQESKISVPLNTIYYVLSESNYISFKNINDNSTVFAVSLDELQINSTQATRENLIALFDSVSNGASGGGGGGGTTDYNELSNKPQINNFELIGNKSLVDLGIQPQGDYATNADLANYATTASTANFITKNVSDLSNYETSTVAQGKYALKANFWSGTQSEYDLISPKDPDTFYFIVEG